MATTALLQAPAPVCTCSSGVSARSCMLCSCCFCWLRSSYWRARRPECTFLTCECDLCRW